MTPLHHGFRRRLLAAYQSLETTEHGPQLTPQHLEQYDILVSKKHFLRLAQRSESEKAAPGLSAVRARRTDKAAEALAEELQQIDRDLQETLSNHMPDFHAIHDSWFSRNFARELYKADCAYGNRLLPVAAVLGVFMACGMISLLAMTP